MNTHRTRDRTSLYLHLYADDHRHETGSERLLTNRILLRRTVQETGQRFLSWRFRSTETVWRIRYQGVIELFCPSGRGSKVTFTHYKQMLGSKVIFTRDKQVLGSKVTFAHCKQVLESKVTFTHYKQVLGSKVTFTHDKQVLGSKVTFTHYISA